MRKMNWLFSLVFLGTAWRSVYTEEVKVSEAVSLPSLEVIESVLRSSFENVSRKHLLGSGSSRKKYGKGKAQEVMGSLHHGIHAPNDNSWKLNCVWEAMNDAANHLNETVFGTRLSDLNRILVDGPVGRLCSRLSKSECGADFEEFICDPNYEYRTVDGTCNNLNNSRWGSASQPFERFLQPDYGDGKESFRKSKKGKELPNPRKISRILSNSKERKTPKVTLMVMQWGQFIDHDVTLTPEREHHEPVDGTKALMCCNGGLSDNSVRLGTDCIPINVKNDAYFNQDNRECIRFVRSMPTSRGCSFTPMEQINQNTAFVDGSQVYGSEKDVADFVRKGYGGLLNTSEPVGTATSQYLPPRGGDDFEHSCPLPESMQQCFLAGDIRVDEMPGLTAMHTVFIRLHNIIATELSSLNNHWDDEMLFQETRRIVSALIQQITYRDWLPHVLPKNLMEELDLGTANIGYKDTYNQNINPTLRNVFSTAAFRFGHTLLTDFVKAAREEDTLPLEGHFFNISVIQSEGTDAASMLKGLSRCPSEPIDGFVANTFTDKLFATPNKKGKFFGLDLVSLNIQRGRDHGIPSYTKWRKFCGLKDIKSFKKLKTAIQKDIAKGFSNIYDKLDDVDIFPAGLSEEPIEGGLLGPTFSCILARSFAQIKHGDRFWYERKNQPKPFTPDQLASIRSLRLASILCKVQESAQYHFQPDPFMVENDPGNTPVDCSDFSFINLDPWKEVRHSSHTPSYTIS